MLLFLDWSPIHTNQQVCFLLHLKLSLHSLERQHNVIWDHQADIQSEGPSSFLGVESTTS